MGLFPRAVWMGLALYAPALAFAAIAGVTIAFAPVAFAQTVAPVAEVPAAAPALHLDLNAVEDANGACRLIFVAENRLGTDLAAAVFEAVFFTPEGVVERLTLLDFQDLPQNRRRVRQFDLPGTGCAALGQVLMNAATECRGEGLDPAACMAGLVATSRVTMGISG